MPKKKKIKKAKKIKIIKKIKNIKKLKKISGKNLIKKSTMPGSDEKPEIKKIKKQATEKKIYNIKDLSLIHISEPTRRTPISYAVFCLKKTYGVIVYGALLC